MNDNQIIKLKPEFSPFSKKIKSPENFDLLMDIIRQIFKNDNPKKIYRIIDKRKNKIIRNQEDYESLLLENFTKKEITLLINIIDKPVEFQEESNHMFFKSNIIIPQKEEITEEEKIKQSIRELVQSKLKTLEKSIIEDISRKMDINPPNVHKGIKCSYCGMENIVGIRYKCTMCPNYNLCEVCEENSEHDENHVLLKIKDPVKSEKVLEQKINDSIILPETDFKVEPEVFEFQRDVMINIQNVNLTNNTSKTWKINTSFVCLKEKSNLFGNDIIFNEEVKPGNNISIEIVYDMDNIDINESQKEFYSSFILLDENKEQIGKIHTFKIYMS